MATYVQNVEVQNAAGAHVAIAVVVEAPSAAAVPEAAKRTLAATNPELRIVKFGSVALVTTT